MRNYIPNLKNGVTPVVKPTIKVPPSHSRTSVIIEKKEEQTSMITNPVMRDLFNAAHSMTYEINNKTVWEKVKQSIYDAIKDSPFVSGVSIQCDHNTNTPSIIRNNLIGLRVSYYDHYLNKRDSLEFTIPLKIDCD